MFFRSSYWFLRRAPSRPSVDPLGRDGGALQVLPDKLVTPPESLVAANGQLTSDAGNSATDLEIAPSDFVTVKVEACALFLKDGHSCPSSDDWANEKHRQDGHAVRSARAVLT